MSSQPGKEVIRSWTPQPFASLPSKNLLPGASVFSGLAIGARTILRMLAYCATITENTNLSSPAWFLFLVLVGTAMALYLTLA
jgi:hypothetical protein